MLISFIIIKYPSCLLNRKYEPYIHQLNNTDIVIIMPGALDQGSFTNQLISFDLKLFISTRLSYISDHIFLPANNLSNSLDQKFLI